MFFKYMPNAESNAKCQGKGMKHLMVEVVTKLIIKNVKEEREHFFFIQFSVTVVN
jgi:hypothetical protein